MKTTMSIQLLGEDNNMVVLENDALDIQYFPRVGDVFNLNYHTGIETEVIGSEFHIDACPNNHAEVCLRTYVLRDGETIDEWLFHFCSNWWEVVEATGDALEVAKKYRWRKGRTPVEVGI